MPKFKKDRSKFTMKGFTPFTKSDELTTEEKEELWDQWEKHQQEKKEEKRKRLALHRPEELEGH